MHAFVSANVTAGKVTSRLYAKRTRTRRTDDLSKTKLIQVAFAHHLLDVTRAYSVDT